MKDCTVESVRASVRNELPEPRTEEISTALRRTAPGLVVGTSGPRWIGFGVGLAISASFDRQTIVPEDLSGKGSDTSHYEVGAELVPRIYVGDSFAITAQVGIAGERRTETAKAEKCSDITDSDGVSLGSSCSEVLQRKGETGIAGTILARVSLTAILSEFPGGVFPGAEVQFGSGELYDFHCHDKCRRFDTAEMRLLAFLAPSVDAFGLRSGVGVLLRFQKGEDDFIPYAFVGANFDSLSKSP